MFAVGTISFLAMLVAQSPDESFGGGQEPSPIEDIERVVRERRAMRKRMAEDRVRSRFLQREESTILGTIRELDGAMEAQHLRAAGILARRSSLEAEISEIDEQLVNLSRKLGTLQQLIGRRAAAMVRLRKTSLSSLLSHAQSASGARQLRDRLRLVLKFDAGLVHDLKVSGDKIRTLKTELEGDQRGLDDARKEQERQIEETMNLREERSALLRAVKSERGLIERLASEIAGAAKKLESDMGTIHGQKPPPPPAAGGFSKQIGRLPWPVVGAIEVGFGKRVDPSSGLVLSHRGLDLRAELGAPVRAAFRGRVAFDGEIEGYGTAVILDHGERWHSVYANLEGTELKTGTLVERHETIGRVGDSEKGPYLYFELRQHKTAVDPRLWLSR